MKKIIIIVFLFMSLFINGFAQDVLPENKVKIYAGYDLGEMVFNKFQNFSGEVGVKFKNGHAVRFAYMNVKLTEKHLSSGFAGAVDGGNVTGLWKGYDLIFDIPLYRFKKNDNVIYGGASVGYHDNTYQHVISEESFSHKTNTVGFGAGFKETNVFNIKGLYVNLYIPFRYYFDTLEEARLGNSIVKKAKLEQTLHFFIGYEW